MNPIRRELLNGLFVLVVASLLSVAFAAFQVKFDVQLWVLILIGIGVAVTGYVIFDIALRYMASTADREKEWLRRVGTPARFEVNEGASAAGADALIEALQAMRPGSDYTVMNYYGSEIHEGLMTKEIRARREKNFGLILEQQRRGVVREYKRIICFDPSVLANDNELRSGVLRVGEGRGTIDKVIGEHCRAMLENKNCALYVAPAVLQSTMILFGADKVAMTVEGIGEDTGSRFAAGVLVFCDPPNSEIIERFRQLERTTERRMVAVQKIRFPEDEVTTGERAAR